MTDARFSSISTGDCIGHIDLGNQIHDAAWGDGQLQIRVAQLIEANPDLSDATRFRAALQSASGGTWGGCVYEVDEIVKKLAE